MQFFGKLSTHVLKIKQLVPKVRQTQIKSKSNSWMGKQMDEPCELILNCKKNRNFWIILKWKKRLSRIVCTYTPLFVRTIIAVAKLWKDASTVAADTAVIESPRLCLILERKFSKSCLWKIAASASRAIWESSRKNNPCIFVIKRC